MKPSKPLILGVLSNGFAGLAAPIRQPAESGLTARCDFVNASGEPLRAIGNFGRIPTTLASPARVRQWRGLCQTRPYET